MTEEVIQKIIENFNKDFNTNLSNGKYDFLASLYEDYVCLSASNDLESKFTNEILELDDTLHTILNKKQLEVYRKFDNAKDELLKINNQHAFIYGFCISQIISKITDSTIIKDTKAK